MSSNTLKPLKVFYYRTWKGESQGSQVVIRSHVSLVSLVDTQHKIDRGEIDEVILVGQAATCGWRLYVEREIVFDSDIDKDHPYYNEVVQASARIRPQVEAIELKEFKL